MFLYEQDHGRAGCADGSNSLSDKLHQGEGLVLQNNGRTKLVGISMIPKTGNKFLDAFLGLPNEALAELNCEIKS